MAGGFAEEIAAWVAKTKVDADEFVGLLTIRIAHEAILSSPVGDGDYWKSPPPKGYIGGHFRANWQLGINAMPSGELDAVDPRGEATMAKFTVGMPEKAAGNVFYIANNAAYALRIEDGWSRQAPQGIVGRIEIGFTQAMAETLREIERR